MKIRQRTTWRVFAWAKIILLMSLANQPLYSQQDSIMLDKSFQFENGIYLSFADFQANQPNYRWEEVDAKLAGTPGSFSAQADYLRIKGGDTLAAADIWGISLNGLPYICLKQRSQESGLIQFAGFKVRGKLCLFTYETEKTEWVEIAAYNPLTGKPFRKGKVSKEVTVDHEYLLDFSSGTIQPFTREGLLGLIEDDNQLWRTVNELSEADAEEKLYRCLLIYDDRNPIYLPVKTTD